MKLKFLNFRFRKHDEEQDKKLEEYINKNVEVNHWAGQAGGFDKFPFFDANQEFREETGGKSLFDDEYFGLLEKIGVPVTSILLKDIYEKPKQFASEFLVAFSNLLNVLGEDAANRLLNVIQEHPEVLDALARKGVISKTQEIKGLLESKDKTNEQIAKAIENIDKDLPDAAKEAERS